MERPDFLRHWPFSLRPFQSRASALHSASSLHHMRPLMCEMGNQHPCGWENRRGHRGFSGGTSNRPCHSWDESDDSLLSAELCSVCWAVKIELSSDLGPSEGRAQGYSGWMGIGWNPSTGPRAILSPTQFMQVHYYHDGCYFFMSNAIFKVLWKLETNIAENKCSWMIQWFIRVLVRQQELAAVLCVGSLEPAATLRKSSCPAKKRRTFSKCLGNSLHFQTVPMITHSGWCICPRCCRLTWDALIL